MSHRKNEVAEMSRRPKQSPTSPLQHCMYMYVRGQHSLSAGRMGNTSRTTGGARALHAKRLLRPKRAVQHHPSLEFRVHDPAILRSDDGLLVRKSTLLGNGFGGVGWPTVFCCCPQPTSEHNVNYCPRNVLKYVSFISFFQTASNSTPIPV